MGLQATREVEKQGLTKSRARGDELVMPQETNTVSWYTATRSCAVQQMVGSCRSEDDEAEGDVYQKHSTVRMRQLNLGEASTASSKYHRVHRERAGFGGTDGYTSSQGSQYWEIG